jgi:putative intracellular protease/amidase/quinol monooxygenase YgiN
MERSVLVRWKIRPSELERILGLLLELAEKSRAEPGNLQYLVFQSQSDPCEIFLIETYVDAEAAEAHRQSEHYQRIVAPAIIPSLDVREVTNVKAILSRTNAAIAARESVMSKKILIIVSNAHEIGPKHRRTGNFLPEVAHPYAEFDRAKYQIDFASLTGESPYLDALNLAGDPDNLAFLVGKGWADMQKAKKLSDVDVSHYDAIFMPGGLAPMVDMPEHPLLKQVIKQTWERGAVVGAVCHGPVSLLNVKLSDGSQLLQGKNISSFTNDEEENYAKADVPFMLETALTKQGALFHKTNPWAAFSIADGKLVTGQNPASAKGVAEKMITVLEAS